MNDEFTVTSEVLPFFEKDTQSRPCVDEKNVISKFTFVTGRSEQGDKTPVQKDEDGDYLVRRKPKELTIFLEHSVSTGIDLVGLQIWRAALLLADFIIERQNLFENETVLELGSGVGLTSIVAGMFAKQVVCTDLDVGNILNLIRCNVNRNKGIIKADVSVVGVDFFNRDWSSDFAEKLEETSIVLAADVIYDNDVTEAFVETITKILNIKPKKVLYLAMEKRYVFTLSDLDSVAPCYEHLMSCLSSARSKPPFSEWRLREVPLDFPQHFNYERVGQLVMYEIST